MNDRRVWPLLLGTALSLALLGCGGDDGSGTTTQSKPAAPATRDVLSADATRAQIAFFRLRDNRIQDLAMTDDRGRRIEPITGDSVQGTAWPQSYTILSWSPDGKELAFAGGEEQRSGSEDDATNLYVVGEGGSGAKRLTDVDDVSAPSWSPDGKQIVFTRTSNAGKLPKGELWSVKPDGSGLKRITHPSEGQSDTAGSFSPDGSKLAFTHLSYNPDTRLTGTAVHTVDPDGSHEKELIEQAGEPAFSPDGKRIAYSTDRDRNGRMCIGGSCGNVRELYLARADGSRRARLTKTSTINEGGPSWSPSGARLAYEAGGVTDERPGSGIFEVNADGTCPTRFLVDTSLEDYYANPAWRPTPKGKRLGPLRC